jgi:chloramphenicol 3-O phosphotransferase
MSTIVLLNGVSSSGKSSLAAALVDAMPGSCARVSIDQFEGMVRNRLRAPRAQDFLDRCLIPVMHRCVAEFATAGVDVVVDTILARPAWLDDAVRQWAGHAVVFVGVHCAPGELQRRERVRGDRRIGQAREQLALVHPHVLARGGYDLEVDTTSASPEACAQHVLALLASGQSPQAFARLSAEADADR